MLVVVPSVLDIVAFGLESDVLPSDAVALTAHVARHITILRRTAVELNAGNVMVKEDLLLSNLRAPPALAVVKPRLLARVLKSARL